MSGRLGSAALICLLLGHPAAGQEREDTPEGEQEEVVLGKSSASRFETEAEPEQIELGRGSRVRLAPEPTSPLLELVHSPVRVEVLDRHEEWVRVRYGVWKGWVLTDGRDTGPLVGFVAGARGAGGARLERARELMGAGGRQTRLGPYALLTDLRDDRLIRRLEGVVEGLAQSYRERFGIDPGPPRGEVIVLFAREAEYRTFERDEMRIAALETLGHTIEGVVTSADLPSEQVISTLSVTFAGDRPFEGVREVLVHELTHLLNRRALGPDVPPWLEEGMAEDLAFSRVDAQGRIELGSWGGGGDQRGYLADVTGRVRFVDAAGSLAALARLISIWQQPQRPELELLTRLPSRVLTDAATRRTLYAESAVLLRYLLDGAGEESAARLRGFLSAYAGGELGPEAFWTRIGVSAEELEELVYLWMRREAGAQGVLFVG